MADYSGLLSGALGATGATSGAISGASDPWNVLRGAIQGGTISPAIASAISSMPNLAGAHPDTIKWWQNKLSSIASGNDQMTSTMDGGAPGAGQTAEGLLSPEELRAKMEAAFGPMQSIIGSGTSAGGGGGGGGSGTGGGAGTGTGLPSTGNDIPQLPPGTSAGINSPQFPNLPPISYAPPGSVPNVQLPTGQPPSMQQPGSPTGQLPGGSQAGITNYLNTPMNQLLGDPSYERFQHSPGYQYAVDEALNQVQRNAASRGLLESGSALRGMTDRAQGMAQQDYNNWWERQNGLYNSYQNRLAGLAGGPTGADMAMQTGQALGAGSMQTGSNLGSLFGNQGNANLGAIMNTGAAQANAMTQAGSQQAQILGANQSAQMAGAVAQQAKGLF